jgi:hypothetical protein
VDEFEKFMDLVRNTEIYGKEIPDKKKAWFTESWFYEVYDNGISKGFRKVNCCKYVDWLSDDSDKNFSGASTK